MQERSNISNIEARDHLSWLVSINLLGPVVWKNMSVINFPFPIPKLNAICYQLHH